MDPPEHTHPYPDGTGAGLLGFCSWLGDQGVVARTETRNLRAAVRRVLQATDGWQRLDVRSLDLALAARRFEAAEASGLQPKTRTIYTNRLRRVARLYWPTWTTLPASAGRVATTIPPLPARRPATTAPPPACSASADGWPTSTW